MSDKLRMCDAEVVSLMFKMPRPEQSLVWPKPNDVAGELVSESRNDLGSAVASSIR